MKKRILVLARRDASEAMRVAAGLTIRNNAVDFVFMIAPARTPSGQIKKFDMLELAEILPQSIIKDIPNTVPCDNLSDLIQQADRVVSL